MKKKIIIPLVAIASIVFFSIFRFSIVTNGDNYYIDETAKKAFIVETIFNDVEPLFLFVIE